VCGRYTLRKPARQIAREFDLPTVPDLPPRYNIAPGQPVPVVRLAPDQGGRELALIDWGLIPPWADDPEADNRLINARAETLAEKPSFRRAFRERRCLVLADGFCEWRRLDGRKQPYFVHMRDDRPFAFAGLWESWDRGGEPMETCAIITTGANDLMAPIHDRMPAIVPQVAYGVWLNGEVRDLSRLRFLLRPYPAEGMDAYPVSRLVNDPANDRAECIRRVG
jgi:putative SOS response-associated peptidase YedK